MLICGHNPTDNIYYRQKTGDYGNKVTEILIDPQQTDRNYGGVGLVAMFYFSNNGKDLEIRYYSTVNGYYFKANNQISLTLDVPDTARYTVTYEANGGMGDMPLDTEILGEYILLENSYTAPDTKRFKGWKVDGEEKNVGDKITVSSNTTVTAVWEDIPKNTKPTAHNNSRLIWIFVPLIIIVSACLSGVIIYKKKRNKT